MVAWILSSPSRKRARIGDISLDHEISLLNESGALQLRDGNIRDAQHFFAKALDHFIVKQLSCSDLLRPTSPSPNRLETALVQCHVSKNQHVISMVDNLSTDPQEYDEGLYTYKDAMTLGGVKCTSVQSTTLYYNVAQTFICQLQFHDAQQWLELAMICCCSNLSTLKRRFSTVEASALVRIQHNMGYCYFRMGRHAEASDCFQRALDLATKAKLGSVYTAGARSAVAVLSLHGETNDTTLSLLQECLAEYEERFGKESKEVATILSNIGRFHYTNGNCEEALKVYEVALCIRRKVLPMESIDIAGAVCSTALTLHHLGDLTRAKLLYQEFLSMATAKIYNVRDVAIIAKNLAEIYRKQKSWNEAKDMFAMSLEAGVTGFGRVHPEVASMLNRLGNLYYELSDLNKALECYTEGLEIEELTLPPNNARIVVTLTNIAQIHYQLGDLDNALCMFRKVHASQVQVYGSENLEVAKSLATMGEIEYKMNNLNAAFALFQEVLVIQRSIFGKDDRSLEIASTFNLIGIVACGLGEFSVAQNCFTPSLAMRRELLGDHNDTATLWYNLATVHEEIGDENVAIAMYEECLRIEHHCDGASQNDVTDSLQRLGRLHQRRGELDKSMAYLTEALDSLRARRQNESETEAKFLILIGNLHRQMGNLGCMMKNYAEAHSLTGDYMAIGSSDDALIKSEYFLRGLAALHPPSACCA